MPYDSAILLIPQFVQPAHWAMAATTDRVYRAPVPKQNWGTPELLVYLAHYISTKYDTAVLAIACLSVALLLCVSEAASITEDDVQLPRRLRFFHQKCLQCWQTVPVAPRPMHCRPCPKMSPFPLNSRGLISEQVSKSKLRGCRTFGPPNSSNWTSTRAQYQVIDVVGHDSEEDGGSAADHCDGLVWGSNRAPFPVCRARRTATATVRARASSSCRFHALRHPHAQNLGARTTEM